MDNIFPASGIENEIEIDVTSYRLEIERKIRVTKVPSRKRAYEAILLGLKLNELQLKLYSNEKTIDQDF